MESPRPQGSEKSDDRSLIQSSNQSVDEKLLHPRALAKNPSSRSLSSPLLQTNPKPKLKVSSPGLQRQVFNLPTRTPLMTSTPRSHAREERRSESDCDRRKFQSLGHSEQKKSPISETLPRRCHTLPAKVRPGSPKTTGGSVRERSTSARYSEHQDVFEDYAADMDESEEQVMEDWIEDDASPQYDDYYSDRFHIPRGLKPTSSHEELRPGPSTSDSHYFHQVEEIARRERRRKKSIESPGRLQNQLAGLSLVVGGHKHGSTRLFGEQHSLLANGAFRLSDDGRKQRVKHLFAQITRTNMKKGEPAPSSVRKKPARSPVLSKKPLSDCGTGSLPSTSRARGASNFSTVSNDSHLAVAATDSFQLSEDDTTDGYQTNGASLDVLDDTDGSVSDPIRTKNALAHLQGKMAKTREQIKLEQKIKEDNVNEYLRLASNADKQQVQRIKLVFEKKNSKSAQNVAQLQKKLENYQRKVKDVENFGVSSHKMAKEVLRDVGQGLKGVGANIRDGITGFSGGVVGNIKGATETIVSKPREIASLIKNKFGSADNIRQLQQLDDSHLSIEEGERSHPGSETLPASFRYQSDDDVSSVTSGSGPSGGLHSSPHLPLALSHTDTNSLPTLANRPANLQRLLLLDEQEYREVQSRLHETIESFKLQMTNDYSYLKQTLDEERYRYERLEEQINDLTELHQHEMTNLKQELSSMEEKIEYQLDERTRDMQEMLETCQTRITKMELQQQQQQLISMEGVENANARMLITKLINVVLAILAVLLVLVSTITNIVSPFITTRLRLLTTFVVVLAFVLAYQNWTAFEGVLHAVGKFLQNFDWRTN